MQIQKIDNKPSFKRLEGVLMSDSFKLGTNPKDISRVLEAINSNGVFKDIFCKKNGYIYLDKEQVAYTAAHSHGLPNIIQNSLNIIFKQDNQEFSANLLSKEKPKNLLKIIDETDPRFDYLGLKYGIDLIDRFCYKIKTYDKGMFKDFTDSIQQKEDLQ